MRSVAAGLTALLMTCSVSKAVDDATVWVRGPSSSARLISGGGLRADQTYRPAIEIELTGDAVTYWRTPGDSGSPPVASFEGSENLASAELQFPAPHRLQEGGSEVYGYRGRALFPVKVVPKDLAQPVTLALDLRYAACDKICVPAEAQGRIVLGPKEPATSHSADIAAAEARVPAPWAAPAPKIAMVRSNSHTWSIKLDPPTPGDDLFAEAPDGWFFETHQASGGFDLVLAERPSEGDEVPVTLTLNSPKGAWERSLKLDVKGATP
jgi:DsbC/DsbD-like thiol-disulfide interchange protein